jgi:hypothetical protein
MCQKGAHQKKSAFSISLHCSAMPLATSCTPKHNRFNRIYCLPCQQIAKRSLSFLSSSSIIRSKVWGLMVCSRRGCFGQVVGEMQPNDQLHYYKRCYNFKPFTIGKYTMHRQLYPPLVLHSDHFLWCYTSTSPVWKPLGQMHTPFLSCVYPPLG